MLKHRAASLDAGDQVEHAVHGVQVGFGLCDLRSDVAVNSNDTQTTQAAGMPVDAQRVLMRHAKLVAFETGRNIRMGFRVYVRVHANADRSAQVHRQRHLTEHIELGFALHIEAADARLQCLAHFTARLADA